MTATNNKYTSLAIEYKKTLNDIIDIAYENDPKIKSYKHFTITCESKKYHFLGQYIPDESRIRLCEIENEPHTNVMVVALHELSHHIEYVKTGQVGHQEGFYAIHKHLLFTAFDMGILKMEDVTASEKKHDRNNNKLAKMMSEYIPHPVEYKKKSITINVYNSYDFKEILKERGYKYNSIDKSWAKTIEEHCNEVEALIEEGIDRNNIKVIDGKSPVNKLKVKIQITGSTYEQKNDIKSCEFIWDKELRLWYKNIFKEDLVREIYGLGALIKKYPSLNVKIDVYRIGWDNNSFWFHNHKTRQDEFSKPEKFVKMMYGGKSATPTATP